MLSVMVHGAPFMTIPNFSHGVVIVVNVLDVYTAHESVRNSEGIRTIELTTRRGAGPSGLPSPDAPPMELWRKSKPCGPSSIHVLRL